MIDRALERIHFHSELWGKYSKAATARHSTLLILPKLGRKTPQGLKPAYWVGFGRHG